ncbi:MAG: NFYB/HAP3 family transcription factor subunit [Candidatus Aenigmatarchaeota archaeon]
MAKKKTYFSVNYFERLIKSLGINRVSREAAKALCFHVEDKVKEILEEASKIAKIAKRNTILREDVKIAIKKIKLYIR